MSEQQFSDRGILNAFERGRAAGAGAKTVRDCPYRGSSEEELYQAWMTGFDEENPLFVSRRTTGS